jgi:hypothetical protein
VIIDSVVDLLLVDVHFSGFNCCNVIIITVYHSEEEAKGMSEMIASTSNEESILPPLL